MNRAKVIWSGDNYHVEEHRPAQSPVLSVYAAVNKRTGNVLSTHMSAAEAVAACRQLAAAINGGVA